MLADLAAAMKPAETTDIVADGLDSVAAVVARLRAEDPELRDDLDLVKVDDDHVAALRDRRQGPRDRPRREAEAPGTGGRQRALDLLGRPRAPTRSAW